MLPLSPTSVHIKLNTNIFEYAVIFLWFSWGLSGLVVLPSILSSSLHWGLGPPWPKEARPQLVQRFILGAEYIWALSGSAFQRSGLVEVHAALCLPIEAFLKKEPFAWLLLPHDPPCSFFHQVTSSLESRSFAGLRGPNTVPAKPRQISEEVLLLAIGSFRLIRLTCT